MIIKRIRRDLVLLGTTGFCAYAHTGIVFSQVVDSGISTAANTFQSFQGASIARDSGLNKPLDLLNDFYPAIVVEIEDHDNVRRRPDFDESDTRLVVKPSLAYRTNIGRHQFYAAYVGTFTRHQEIDQEDAESNIVSANLGLDLTRRWDLDLFGSVGNGFEERSISGSREFNQFSNNGIDSGPENVDFRSYGADLSFGRQNGIVTAVLGYEYNETSFDNDNLFNNADAGDRDREAESVHLDLSWHFASKTSVFGRVQYTETDFNSPQSSLDNEQVEYVAGLRFKPANTLSGVVGVGRTVREFDDIEREEFDGSTYYVNLNYSINPFSNIAFNASRFVEDPSDEDSSFFESELFGLSWTHSLSEKLIFNSYAKLIDDDFDNDREDQFVDWGLGLDYVWRSWLTAGVYYGDIERTSTDETVEFDDRFVGIRFTSDLRSFLKGRSKKRREPASFGEPKKTSFSQ